MKCPGGGDRKGRLALSLALLMLAGSLAVMAWNAPGLGRAFGSGRATPLGFGRPRPSERFQAVAAVAPDDVWAVGGRTDGRTYAPHSLVEHWDGSIWRMVPCPDIGMLWAVDVVPGGGVWAAGSRKLLHWNRGRWLSVGPAPVPGMSLTALAGSSSSDIWAVGTRTGWRYAPHTLGTNTLIEHWDGNAWRVVLSPDPTKRGNWLEGVVVLSRANAWAVGYSQRRRVPRSLALHWDGKAWRVVPSPNPSHNPNASRRYNVLWGAGTDGEGGAWAVGHFGARHLSSFFLRWDGTRWRRLRIEDDNWTPTALAGAASDDVWAVGSEPTSDLRVAHWGGSRWTTVPVPRTGPDYSASLTGVAALSPSDAWAVGFGQMPRRHPPALIGHWDGARWRLVPPARL
jgi:hypothetical protein